MTRHSPQQENGTSLMELEELREPPKAMVLLLNDDYTTMEFVVCILMDIFHKNAVEAERIMLAVHERGKGECGIYPVEIAETKVSLVSSKAAVAGFPLRCVINLL